MTPFDDTKAHAPADPAAHGLTEFDFDEVCRRLDGEGAPDSSPVALVAFCRLLDALMPPRPTFGVREVRAIGLRMVALGWVLNPANIPGTPSLAELARRCRTTKNHMTSLTAEMSRLARWRNRAQQHAWNWARPDEMGVPDEV